MRLKLIMLILVLSCMVFTFTSCNGGRRVIVISIRGSSASSNVIHDVVSECAREYGYTLTEGENWTSKSADGVAHKHECRDIRDEINTLVSRNGGDKSNLSLLVVGKSAGGVLAWYTFNRHYDEIDDFDRVALVLVDPHGAAFGDDVTGSYCDRRNLWWPDDWSSNTNFLRVYNVYQYEERPTGANFPDSRVYRNIRITESSITHDNISGNAQTRELITEALNFARFGNGG